MHPVKIIIKISSSKNKDELLEAEQNCDKGTSNSSRLYKIMNTKIEKQEQWFQVVEIEVNSKCNRRCTYCPVSVLPPSKVPEFMDDEVFDRILNELVRIKFCGKISYHLYSEPLLRKDLENLVKKVKINLPNAFQLLYTNGDFLSDKRYSSLKEAGIDHFLITRHNFVPISKRREQTVLMPTEIILNNRSGILYDLKEPLIYPCYAPVDRFVVTVTGDVLICCNDAKRNYAIGTIQEQSLEEIWFSKKFINIRELLKKGKRSKASPLCKNCDDKECFAPGEDYTKHLKKSKKK